MTQLGHLGVVFAVFPTKSNPCSKSLPRIGLGFAWYPLGACGHARALTGGPILAISRAAGL